MATKVLKEIKVLKEFKEQLAIKVPLAHKDHKEI
jgi:hypothetical protein